MEAKFRRISTHLANGNFNDRTSNFAISAVGGLAVGFMIKSGHVQSTIAALTLLIILVKPNLNSIQMDWNSISELGFLATEYSSDTANVIGTAIGLFFSMYIDYSTLIGLTLAALAYMVTL